MKKFSILLLVVTLLAVSGFAQNKTSAAKMPAIKKVTAKDVRNMMDTTTGPLIINFWASWCGPCVKEIPWFERIVAESEKPVKLILVSLDFPEDFPAKLQAFVKKQGYKAEVVFLNESNADYFIPVIDSIWNGALPGSVFINNSKKYYQFFNGQLHEEEFKKELKKLVE